MPNFTVLLIDSDASAIAPILAPALLIVALRLLGAQVLRAPTCSEGLRLLYDSRPDVLVLPTDACAPSAYATLARVRAVASLPIVMVGPAYDSQALAAGADDYVTTPVDENELAVRIQRLAERESSHGRGFRDAELVVDFEAIEVLVDGTPIALTRLEYRLLEALVADAGSVVETDRLLTLAWDEPVYDRARVKAHIAALRRKLGPVAERIETIRGAGYRYRPLGSG